MNLNITFYGCARHFLGMAPERRHVSVAGIEKSFGIKYKHLIPSAVSKPDPIGVTITINYEEVPIPRTYVADAVLLYSNETRAFSANRLHRIAKELGDLWVEYVRTFIDSGALIAIRVTMRRRQVRWSPHGSGD